MTDIKNIQVRRATEADENRLRAFQAAALRMLAAADYSRPLVDRFISQVGTIDHAMLTHGRFFMLELHGELVGCGGWTAEASTYTSLARGPLPALPDCAATIQGVYVDPALARRGIGSKVLALIEQDLVANDRQHVQLCSTLTGAAFYLARGYRRTGVLTLALPDGQALDVVAMAKVIAQPIAKPIAKAA